MKTTNSDKNQPDRSKGEKRKISSHELNPEKTASEIQFNAKLDKLIQDLEYKTLTLEISENKLREESEHAKSMSAKSLL